MPLVVGGEYAVEVGAGHEQPFGLGVAAHGLEVPSGQKGGVGLHIVVGEGLKIAGQAVKGELLVHRALNVRNSFAAALDQMLRSQIAAADIVDVYGVNAVFGQGAFDADEGNAFVRVAQLLDGSKILGIFPADRLSPE